MYTTYLYINLSGVKYENQYKSRNKPSYKIPFSKSTQLINSILITGPKLWNNTHNHIKNIKNKNKYKKKLKIYSFNQYIINKLYLFIYM